MKKLFRHLASVLGTKPDPSPAPSQRPFHPYNGIERLLMDAARNPEARETFQRALMDAELYAATPEVPETGGYRTLQSGENVRLLNVKSPDGAPVAAIFTAQERVAEIFGSGVGFIGIKGNVLLDILAANGAWLNPGLSFGVYWDAQQLAALLGKPVSRTVKKDTKIMLGSPARRPEDLIAALKAALANDSAIERAWLALAHWPEEEKSSWYLDVRTHLPPAEVSARLKSVFMGGPFEGRPLDMVVNAPGAKDGIGIPIVPPEPA
jgi:hypothetical protein